jgi:hypothetical protein
VTTQRIEAVGSAPRGWHVLTLRLREPNVVAAQRSPRGHDLTRGVLGTLLEPVVRFPVAGVRAVSVLPYPDAPAAPDMGREIVERVEDLAAVVGVLRKLSNAQQRSTKQRDVLVAVAERLGNGLPQPRPEADLPVRDEAFREGEGSVFNDHPARVHGRHGIPGHTDVAFR